MNQDRLNISADEANAGCREFDAGDCIECCSSVASLEGKDVECLVLNADGERLISSPCDEACPACARCSVEDETTLYDLARSLNCDCSILDGKLGFDPDVPCEQDCYNLKSAAYSCPHKVCKD